MAQLQAVSRARLRGAVATHAIVTRTGRSRADVGDLSEDKPTAGSPSGPVELLRDGALRVREPGPQKDDRSGDQQPSILLRPSGCDSVTPDPPFPFGVHPEGAAPAVRPGQISGPRPPGLRRSKGHSYTPKALEGEGRRESGGLRRRRAPAMRAALAAPLLQLLLQLLLLLGPRLQAAGVPEPPLPTVVLAILARNAEHSLPHYLGALERLDYPRARMALWCATDHNVDNTTGMLQEWLAAVGSDYAAVVWRPEEEARSYPEEKGPKHWTRERHQFLMELRQEALSFARSWGADYILFADTDNILTNNQSLRLLMERGLPVVAPMLDSQTYYSNFWCGITPQGYYRRTADYFPTKNRQRRGCFQVPMVHSTFLVSLRAEGTSQLAFYPPHPNYTWPFDDIIVFAYACQAAGVSVHVCNEHRYGYMNVGVKPQQGLEDEKTNFIHLVLEALVDGPPMQASAHVSLPPKKPSKMGFEEVFLISLARRPQRRARMLSSLWEMEISARVLDAVDGRTLNSSILRSLGVDLLPGYQDPYSGRTLTKGEVGCFLSHYSIWEEVVARGLTRVVVLEDDVRFESNFRRRLERLMEDVETQKFPWDLIYLGRKQVNPEEEVVVEELPSLVVAGYSYWTLAYALSLAGARKLLASQPLRRMLPVDEFLPIMFDQHPNEDYKAHFWPRDLRAFSIRPLLAAPTHYAGDAEWLSDTETSSPWDDDSGRLISWTGSQKTLRDPRLDLAGSSGHSLHPHPRDEL